MTITEKLADKEIKSAIDTMRFESAVERDVKQILESAEKEIISIVVKNDILKSEKTIYQNARKIKTQKQANNVIKKTYKQLEKTSKKAMSNLAAVRGNAFINGFNDIVGANILTHKNNNDFSKMITSNVMIDGKYINEVFKDQAEKISKALNSVLNKTIQSYSEGLTTVEAYGTLLIGLKGTASKSGVFTAAYNDLTAIIQTSMMTIHNNSIRQVCSMHPEIFKGYIWVSVLDKRTTPICRALSNRKFTLNYKPIGHTIRYPGGPPAHWRCRSILVPFTKKYSTIMRSGELSRRQRARMKGLSSEAKKMFSEKINLDEDYTKWFQRQTTNTKKDILGPRRFDLYKKNRLTMGDMIDSFGRPLKVKQLYKKYGNPYK